MSAFIVSKEHIDYLVAGAQMGKRSMGTMRWSWLDSPIAGQTQSFEVAGAEYAGQMLWDENIKSVHTRYPGEQLEELPGTIGEDYRYTAIGYMAVDPLQVLKAADCYEYQSCEHTEEWERSEAKAFIDELRRRMIRCLPGYDKARWDINAV